jgi:hypothetical protein
MTLEELEFLSSKAANSIQKAASLFHPHQMMQCSDWRSCLGVDSAPPIIAEVGPAATTFPFGQAAVIRGGDMHFSLGRVARGKRRALVWGMRKARA